MTSTKRSASRRQPGSWCCSFSVAVRRYAISSWFYAPRQAEALGKPAAVQLWEYLVGTDEICCKQCDRRKVVVNDRFSTLYRFSEDEVRDQREVQRIRRPHESCAWTNVCSFQGPRKRNGLFVNRRRLSRFGICGNVFIKVWIMFFRWLETIWMVAVRCSEKNVQIRTMVLQH